MNIEIKILNDSAVMPTRGSKYAAGYDLYAAIENPVDIQPHDTVKIGTGIAVALPSGTFGGIFPRSGIATKRGLRCANCVGAIDEDYRGELIVAVHNDTTEMQTITPQERIAQLIVMPYINFDFTEVKELSKTERGEGGFGSSGTH